MSSESESEQLSAEGFESGEEQSSDSQAEELDSSVEMEEGEGEEDSGSEEDESDEGEGEEDDKEDDSEEDDEDDDTSNQGEKVPFDKPKKGTKANVLNQYIENQGKSLYVRFPHKLTTDEKALEKQLKGICNRIIKVRRPRQNSARFCLVDFDSVEDRAKATKELREVKVDGRKLFIRVPKTEKEDFLQKIAEKTEEKKAKQKEKRKLKKLAAKQKPEKTFTSTLIVRNIPLGLTTSDIKELFPQAVDIQVNAVKGIQDIVTASVTLPTPKDATKARRQKYKLGENILQVSFSSTKQAPEMKTIDKVDQPEPDSSATKIEKRKLKDPASTGSPSPKKMKPSNENQTELEKNNVKNAKKKKVQKNKKVNPVQKQQSTEKSNNKTQLQGEIKKQIEKEGLVNNQKQNKNEQQFKNKGQFKNQQKNKNEKQNPSKKQFKNQKQNKGEKQGQNQKQFTNKKQFKKGNPKKAFKPGKVKAK